MPRNLFGELVSNGLTAELCEICSPATALRLKLL